MKTTAEILESAREFKETELVASSISPAALLKEYTDRFDGLARRAAELRESAIREMDSDTSASENSTMRNILKDRVDALTLPIHLLSRAISQLIEHGRFGAAIERVELQVRLADLEASLQAARELVHRPIAKMKKRHS